MTVDLDVVLQAAAQLAIVIGAIAAGVVWLRKWLRQQVSEPLGRMQTDVTSVQAEVSPNHGASMKDAVDRTERKLDAMVRRFEDHLLLGHNNPAPHHTQDG
jgi:hypothetical protein